MPEPSEATPDVGGPASPRAPHRILGVRIDDVTYNEALQYCASVIEATQDGGRPRYVVTPNPEFVMVARRDVDFARILDGAGLAICDGVGLRLAGRMAGTPFREQVRGTDLAYGLVAMAAQHGWRIFLLGAAPGVADAAANILRRDHPGLVIAGTFAGDATAAGDRATTEAIQRAGRCDLLFVAYGAPRQERWIDRNLGTLDVGVAIGVGGVLDFMAGRVQRAPEWIRNAGFDWFYRLVKQPHRLGRQTSTLPPFAFWSVLAAIRQRLGMR